MASFFDTTIGQQVEFNRLLARAGFTDADIARVIKEPDLAFKMHAALLPSTFVVAEPPSWYVSPEQQIERVWELNAAYDWGFKDSDFPSIPKFAPRTETEVLILAVYLPKKRGRQSNMQRTFDELWDLIEAPLGYTKHCLVDLNLDINRLRQVPGYGYSYGIRWLAFDPNANHGMSPEAALKQSKIDNVQLAGVEVLMAALLFPNWANSWNGKSSPYPNLSGLLQLDRSHVPYLSQWGGGRRQLGLGLNPANLARADWSSSTVREC